MNLENHSEGENPTGHNLTVDNVHFDHYQIAGVLVEASRKTVEIKNCVFSNPLAGINWNLAFGVHAANAPRLFYAPDDPRYRDTYLNGDLSVTDCFFYLEESGVQGGGILLDVSDTLANFTASGNHIYARDFGTWDSKGIWCRSLPNTNVYIEGNPFIQANWGIKIDRHGELPPGYAEIKNNPDIVVDGFYFANWSSGIDFVGSDKGALIEWNHVTINGWSGVGIAGYQSSNCTLQHNTVETGEPLPFIPFGPLCMFGITADGETNPERVDEGRITSGNKILNNTLIGNFVIGSVTRDTDGMEFEQNDFSQARCYNIWPAWEGPAYSNPSAVLGAQLVAGPGATNGQFIGNTFGPVYNVVGLNEFGLPDLSVVEQIGPTVHVGPSWYHFLIEGYDNQNPLSDNHFSGNDYTGTGLPGWSAVWGSQGAVELTGTGCIFADMSSKKVTFDERDVSFPPGTTACKQILDLGSANHLLDEQNKNLNCNKDQDTSILRQYFNDNRASIQKHEFRAWELGKGIPGLLNGIYPHWPKYPYEE
jgi:hypothetical protein